MSLDKPRADLAAALRSSLGLDADTAAAIVASLAAGAPPDDVAPLFGGDPVAEAALAAFIAARDGGGGPTTAGSTVSAAPPRPPARPQPAAAAPPPLPSNAPGRAGGRAGGALTFREAKGKGKAKADGGGSGPPDRTHALCLMCGLITPTAGKGAATRALLESGGRCPACGARVALREGDPADARPLPAGAAGALRGRMGELEAAAAAGVCVHDDDAVGGAADVASDPWLAPAQKAAAAAAAKAAAAAAADAARDRSVTVSVDLLGRGVAESGGGRVRVDPEIAARRAADAAAVAAVQSAPAVVATADAPSSASTWSAAAAAADTATGPRAALGPAPGLPFPPPKFKMPVFEDEPADDDGDAGGGRPGLPGAPGQEAAPRLVPGYNC